MRLLFAVLAAVIVGLAAPAGAATYHDEATAAGWAWARIRRDEIADLNLRCGRKRSHYDSDADDPAWSDDCRKIAPTFVTDILTEPQLRGQIKRHGMRLVGAQIDGSLDLVDAAIAAEVRIEESRIDGDLNLSTAHLTHLLSLDGTRIGGEFAAFSVRADSNLLLRHGATFKGQVGLAGAKVEGDVSMIGSTFEEAVTTDGMKVGGNLNMRDHATFKREVVLLGAKVEGQVSMIGSTFEGPVNAQMMTVGGSLLLRDAHFAAPLELIDTHIGGSLDLRGAVASGIDLSGMAVAGELLLGGGMAGLQWQCPTFFVPQRQNADTPKSQPSAAGRWPLGDPKSRYDPCGRGFFAPRLVLRNTKVGALQDSADAWPPVLDLEGFKYDRLGGYLDDARARSAEQWQDWLQRDRTFGAQPYTQLSNVLLAAGNRDSAEAIQYAGRVRQRNEEKAWGAWLWLLVWGGVAGYGVGLYTFRVLFWVALLTTLGAAALHYSPYARRRGVLWRFGASLHRLLPIVELNKEFKDFFDNPLPDRLNDEPRNLNGPLVVFFIGLALAGWVLGFILLAAMGGLIPKS